MNISLAPHAAAGAAGAHGKAAKGGDPLADFMAMLTQLGITVEEDGTLATATAPVTPAAQDIASKLLAKLGKKGEDAPTQGKPEDVLPELATGEKDKKADDPVTTLADLLTQIDPAAVKSTDPAKVDVASLIAAVRAFVSNTAKTPETETKSTDPTTPIAATASPSIAALLARGSRVASGEKPVEPGAVQSAFVKLEALVSDEGKPTETVDTIVPEAKDEKAAIPEKGTAAAKLTELLARLTASTKPGAGQGQAAANAPSPANAARPQVDPQLAALAQAIQNVTRDDQPKSDAADPSSGTPAIPGIATPSAPVAAQRADALPTDIAQANPSEEVFKHHLDLVKDTQWLDTLARDIARAAQNDNPLRFQLNPEHLGSLKVELVNGANGTSVKLTADTEAARAILSDAQPRLLAEARAQGLRISEAHVDLSGHGGGQRHMAETPVMIRTASGTTLAEVEQDKPGASGERYA